jgi:DNA-directed RNA polymerase specialized sigma24 family protein
MLPAGSVTCWLKGLAEKDRVAAQKLWEKYFTRLVGLARKRLRDVPRRAADEEDTALSAFDSFCRGAERGRFPRLADRDDLWQVLVMITARKACDLIEHEGREKRNWRRNEGAGLSPATDESYFPELIGREPDPALVAEVTEECQRLLDALSNEELRRVALAKMEGQTNEEIAESLGRSVDAVERKLRLIRGIWRAKADGN